MTQEAKASTAGSTQRQAAGLGRIFPGASATRGASTEANGSGAPSRRHRLFFLFAAVLATSACLGSGLASAAEPPEPPVYFSSFGPDGTEATDFEGFVHWVTMDQQTGAVYVLNREGGGVAGSLYKFDEDGQPVDFTGTAPYIDGNKIEGLSFPGQVAVDSTSHVIYVVDRTFGDTSVRAFQEDGEEHQFTAGPDAGTSEITGAESLAGLAVDANGALYLSDDQAGEVSIYAATGEPIAYFGEEHPDLVAVASNGVVYLTQSAFGNLIYKFTPSAFPVTPTTTYTKSPTPFTDSTNFSAGGLAVDPLTDNVYVLRPMVQPTSSDSVITEYDSTGAVIGTFGKDGEPGDLKEGAGIVVNGATSRFYVGNNNNNDGLHKVEIFGPPVYLPFPPTVESSTALNVTADSAKLRAKINPNTLETTYHFEYGPEDCSLTSCTQITPAEPSIGSGHKGVFVFSQLTGLQAGTTYHYRVVAENSLDPPTEGPDRTFTTQVSGIGFQLPDSRVWEMVSPPNKFNGQVVSDDTAIVQASSMGDGLAYPSVGSIVGEPQGSRIPQPSTVLARRDQDGNWASEDLTPPHTEATLVSGDTEFKLFTQDLLRAAMVPIDETPLSPQASELTPYLWSDGDPPSFDPLVNPTNVSPGIKFGPNGAPVVDHPMGIEGASPDLDHVVISSEAPLLEGEQTGNTYFWSGGELEALTELPESEGGGLAAGGALGSGRGSVRHAVSSDGTRVFWTSPSLTALYLRDTVADESIRLDVEKGGSGEGANQPVFTIASADGSVVFFTDSQHLTADASPEGRDLYRCEIGQVGGSLACAELTDISGQTASPGESAEVFPQVSAATDDGTRLYFVARGVLDEAPNAEGDAAEPGEPNLYYWQQGEGLRFIATLSERDHPVWGTGEGLAMQISAAASPSGRFFAFTSERGLTGRESRNASDQPTTGAFLYDAESDALTCVSCNPSGADPVGELVAEKVNFPPDPKMLWQNRWMAATLPEASETGHFISLYRPRTVLDNGRVFFNSPDPLVPADSNGNWDVYQFEPLGVGSCSEETSAAATTRSGGGCLSLISSGTSEGDSGFLDTTPSGNDVFFVTRGRLSVLDFDDERDVYDARVDGIAAQLPSNPECQGEACQPPASSPDDPTPASAVFQGAGNVKPKAPKRCPKAKRKVRRNGKTRCVSRKSNRKRANSNRRAGR